MPETITSYLSPSAGSPARAFVRAALLDLAIGLAGCSAIIAGSRLGLLGPAWLLTAIFPVMAWCMGCHYLLWRGVETESRLLNLLRLGLSAVAALATLGIVLVQLSMALPDRARDGAAAPWPDRPARLSPPRAEAGDAPRDFR